MTQIKIHHVLHSEKWIHFCYQNTHLGQMAKFGKVFAFLSLHLPNDGFLENLLRNLVFIK